jgi:hypothetical protein
MSNDKELLARLKKDWFGNRKTEALIETDLALIMPFGHASAYALDTDGNVVGFKYAGSNYKNIISQILKFQRLERLVLHIREARAKLPSTINRLRHLKTLWLGGGFTKLPPELLTLDLPINVYDRHFIDALIPYIERETLEQLSTFADSIDVPLEVSFAPRKELKRQERGQFAQLPTANLIRGELAHVRGIFLQLDRLEDPPLEIAIKGREALLTYFRERSSGTLPLNELKVLLVGNGAAGKTSLVKLMLGDTFDPDEPQTHGINIRSWPIQTSSGKDVKLNFWDFGGQEIMHATHQFFLSKRSMYILVLDGRKDEDPEYWLQHIESFGGDSPVMIVLNKIDEHPAFDVNRRFLRNKYKGIIDFFRVSCATKTGVEELVRRLVEEVNRVPMMQTLWPIDWFRVKQRLENLDSAYISFQQYREICEQESVEELKSQETLVDFLNDLGVVLHFKDMALLDTHVLDPRWVTEAVYRIINSALLANQKGVLQLNQLDETLKPRPGQTIVYPSEKHRYIVDLMLKFELCYELDGNSILVPDLLDIQEPAILFESEDQLRFVFEYTYLPKSIMPRFIVRMHRDIKGGMRWRTGVILEEKSFEALALIRADEKDKKISISVAGKQKRDYFAVIRKVFRDLNASFEKLNVTEMVPLPDMPEVMLDYMELVGHELGGRSEIYVGRLRRAYSVQALLNPIEKKAEREGHSYPLVLNVGRDFVSQTVTNASHSTVSNSPQTGEGEKMSYTPQTWEKVIVYITGFLFLAVVSFLLIRNQPIADKNLVVALRIILSMVIAVFGATVPGMLKVGFSAKGWTIRAMGALALFVITYMLTPEAL